jgi:hypothetical protein
LIRGHKKQEARPAPVNQETPVSISPAAKPSLKNALWPLIYKYTHILNTKQIIRITFIISCIYLLVSIIYPWVGLRKIKLPKVTEAKITAQQAEAKQEIKPFEFYLEGAKNRQIFAGTLAQGTALPASAASADLIKEVNLVGIIAGENPQAIIEDKKSQKTYYVSKGQFVGEFQVDDILEGKIILNYKGQRYELYL